METSITAHLLSTTTTAFNLATQPPFLRAAGRGRVPTPLLAAYLSQDRLYQHAYVRFVAQMLGKLRFDAPLEPGSDERHGLERRTMDALIHALGGIRHELEFFEEVASKYGFALSASTTTGTGPTPITRAYMDFFTSVASPSASLLEGLLALWATEKCYLDAWRFAASLDTSASEASAYKRDADGGAIRKELMPSWTSEAFEQVVEGMGQLVDEVAEAERKRLSGGEAGASSEWRVVERRCEEVWRQILWLEERFWPAVEEEGETVK